MKTPLPTKTCAVCGRTITWRKKWERSWPQVKYCSDACRRKKSAAASSSLDAEILQMLSMRANGVTICPSDVARKVEPDDWRPLMEPVREAARRLVAKGAVEITQNGRVVDPSTVRGPIRLRLRKA